MRQLGKLVALLGLILGLVGLGINLYAIMPNLLSGTGSPARSLPDALIYFWTFFTHLTNLALVLVYVSELTASRGLGWFRKPITRASWAGNIALVMVFFHVMLAPHYHFEGALAVGNVLLHYVTPLTYLLWWALFSPHGTLRLRDLPAMLLPGLLYLAWVMLRGSVTNEYPYSILDAHTYGYGVVAIGAGIVVGAVGVFCTVLALIDRFLPRQGPASGETVTSAEPKGWRKGAA